jgi:hypothetical protein
MSNISLCRYFKIVALPPVIHGIQFFVVAGDLDSFFTQAEKQRLIYKEIENIRASELDLHIPGYEQHKLYPGKSISMCSVRYIG